MWAADERLWTVGEKTGVAVGTRCKYRPYRAFQGNTVVRRRNEGITSWSECALYRFSGSSLAEWKRSTRKARETRPENARRKSRKRDRGNTIKRSISRLGATNKVDVAVVILPQRIQKWGRHGCFRVVVIGPLQSPKTGGVLLVVCCSPTTGTPLAESNDEKKEGPALGLYFYPNKRRCTDWPAKNRGCDREFLAATKDENQTRTADRSESRLFLFFSIGGLASEVLSCSCAWLPHCPARRKHKTDNLSVFF